MTEPTKNWLPVIKRRQQKPRSQILAYSSALIQGTTSKAIYIKSSRVPKSYIAQLSAVKHIHDVFLD
eukprot:1151649-Pelagomonas_calceolata.AAC.4